MGFFTDNEKLGLRIERMIMHVVSKSPFQNATQFSQVEHESYFLARLADMDAASNFEFVEESVTKDTIRKMGSGEITFQAGSRLLSRAFATTHSGNTKDGAFFIFEMSSGNSAAQFYAMLKYDYKTVLARSRKVDATKNLRKIIDAFVQDSTALQKSCIVRYENGAVSAVVSAKDRMGKAPDLTDYFKRFLDVVRDRSDEELNRAASSVVLEVLRKHESLLPVGGIKPALQVAHEILRSAEEITSDVIVRAVVRAVAIKDDQPFIDNLSKETLRRVHSSGLDGLNFPPVASVYRRANRVILKTKELVEIAYPAGLEGTRVIRVASNDGGEVITITTGSKVEEKIVSEKSN